MQSDINFTFLNEFLHMEFYENGRVEYNFKIILLLGY